MNKATSKLRAQVAKRAHFLAVKGPRKDRKGPACCVHKAAADRNMSQSPRQRMIKHQNTSKSKDFVLEIEDNCGKTKQQNNEIRGLLRNAHTIQHLIKYNQNDKREIGRN